MPNFFRIVLCPPLPVMGEACERIRLFCERHIDAATPAAAAPKKKLSLAQRMGKMLVQANKEGRLEGAVNKMEAELGEEAE